MNDDVFSTMQRTSASEERLSSSELAEADCFDSIDGLRCGPATDHLCWQLDERQTVHCFFQDSGESMNLSGNPVSDPRSAFSSGSLSTALSKEIETSDDRSEFGKVCSRHATHLHHGRNQLSLSRSPNTHEDCFHSQNHGLRFCDHEEDCGSFNDLEPVAALPHDTGKVSGDLQLMCQTAEGTPVDAVSPSRTFSADWRDVWKTGDSTNHRCDSYSRTLSLKEDIGSRELLKTRKMNSCIEYCLLSSMKDQSQNADGCYEIPVLDNGLNHERLGSLMNLKYRNLSVFGKNGELADAVTSVQQGCDDGQNDMRVKCCSIHTSTNNGQRLGVDNNDAATEGFCQRAGVSIHPGDSMQKTQVNVKKKKHKTRKINGRSIPEETKDTKDDVICNNKKKSTCSENSRSDNLCADRGIPTVEGEKFATGAKGKHQRKSKQKARKMAKQARQTNFNMGKPEKVEDEQPKLSGRAGIESLGGFNVANDHRTLELETDLSDVVDRGSKEETETNEVLKPSGTASFKETSFNSEDVQNCCALGTEVETMWHYEKATEMGEVSAEERDDDKFRLIYAAKLKGNEGDCTGEELDKAKEEKLVEDERGKAEKTGEEKLVEDGERVINISEENQPIDIFDSALPAEHLVFQNKAGDAHDSFSVGNVASEDVQQSHEVERLPVWDVSFKAVSSNFFHGENLLVEGDDRHGYKYDSVVDAWIQKGSEEKVVQRVRSRDEDECLCGELELSNSEDYLSEDSHVEKNTVSNIKKSVSGRFIEDAKFLKEDGNDVDDETNQSFCKTWIESNKVERVEDRGVGDKPIIWMNPEEDKGIPKKEFEICDVGEEFQPDKVDSTDELTELNDIPEKFLVPSVCSAVRNIVTPQEDLGFAKVPGYIPELDKMEEESDDVFGTSVQSSGDQEKYEKGTATEAIQVTPSKFLSQEKSDSSEQLFDASKSRPGARPKELASSCSEIHRSSVSSSSPKPSSLLKLARPNSLLGLSKPDVNLLSLRSEFKVSQSNDAIHQKVTTDQGLFGLQPRTRKRFTFPSTGNDFPVSGTTLTMSLAPSVAVVETTSDQHLKQDEVVSASCEVLSGADSEAPSSSVVPPPSSSVVPPPSSSVVLPCPLKSQPTASPVRPAGWSKTLPASVKNKSSLPKRPNSLNITMSNVLPGKPQSMTEKIVEGGESVSGIEVPLTTPCKAGFSLHESLTTSVDKSTTENSDAVRAEEEGAVTDVLNASPIAPVSSAVMTPPISSNINLRITELGKVAPVWVPDGDAPRCMHCDSRFTFTRRRHHCRACGKVFCSGCCNVRVKLSYLESKEARVCSKCYQDLLCAQLYENSSMTLNNQVITFPNSRRSRRRRIPAESQQTSTGSSAAVTRKNECVDVKQVKLVDSSCTDETDASRLTSEFATRGSCKEKLNFTSSQESVVKNRFIEGIRTPLWSDCNGLNMNVMTMSESSAPSDFMLLPNLKVSVSIVDSDCCMGRTCWCFVTSGLCAVGQDEVVYVLERLPDEQLIPHDIFYHICELYHQAAKGNSVGCLGHTLVPEGGIFLDSAEHAGFLYLQPTFQCLHKLPLPPVPYLFGILVHRREVPWLRVFPIRLMLRLGAQYRYYPCPLVSMRFREPVYGEIGHTIMNLLIDLRNFQYRLPHIDDLVVHMEDKKTFINLPRTRYRDIKRAFNSNNDHVMALEASFSCVADSHLVCFQNPDGKYVTQAINIQNQPRKITGASFVVFNGALKPVSGMRAKCSMVEDGLMVQVSPNVMRELKLAVSNAQDFSIGCGRLSAPQPEEWVILKWTDGCNELSTRSFNYIQSPIDGLLLSRTKSRRILASSDYTSQHLSIRWTEIFYLEEAGTTELWMSDSYSFEDSIAQACCLALKPHLENLKLTPLMRVALRVTTDPNKRDYKIGANGRLLPDFNTDDLIMKLVPVLENPQGHYRGMTSILELVFYILKHHPEPHALEP